MKSIRIILAVAVAIIGLQLIQSCKKDAEQKLPEQSDLSNSALIQVYNAVVGSNRNYVYVDAAPVNGATVSYGSAFPSAAYGFAVSTGQHSFILKDTMGTTMQIPLTFTANFEAGKSYTVFAYDTITSPKQIIVPTTIEIPADTTARVRFANFTYSTTVIQPVDIYSVKRQTNIFSNISNAEVTTFIPYASALNDTLIVRSAGTTQLLAQLNGFNPTQKRSYTVVLRGGVTKILTSFGNR
jgi:hypothetical protein